MLIDVSSVCFDESLTLASVFNSIPTIYYNIFTGIKYFIIILQCIGRYMFCVMIIYTILVLLVIISYSKIVYLNIY